MSDAAVPRGGLEADVVLDGIVIEVAGIPLSLRATDQARAEAVASLFRHARTSPAAPDCTLVFGDDDLDVPTVPPTATGSHARLWHTEPHAFWIKSDEGVVARCDDHTIAIAGDTHALAREFRFVCLIALTHLLARHGVHLLHGAAMVVDDRAVLVLGGTGTGKSTIAFAAHARGWPVLADDAVLVRRIDGLVYTEGLPRPISVPADVVGDAVRGGRPVPDDVRRRIELPPGTLTETSHAVNAVLVTAGADDRGSALEPLPGPEVLRMVLQASTSLADPAVRPELFALAGVLARMPAWSVRHGTDLGRAFVDAATGLDQLTELLREAGVGSSRRTGS